MANTPYLGIALLDEGQADKEVTINQALLIMEVVSGGGVKDRDLATPPGSPAEGDGYIVAASPTDAWAGQAGSIAIYLNTGWFFLAPAEGLRLWVQDEQISIAYAGGSWQNIDLLEFKIPYVDIGGTTHTATISNLGAMILFNSASACTLTLPQSSTESLPRGFQIMVRNAGAGTLTIATEGSDTLTPGGTVNDPNLVTSIILETAGSPNAWLATGDLS